VPQDLAIGKDRILDIGEKTIKEYNGIIAGAGTIIWNGPMGWFENKKFRKGTEMIWKAVRQLADKNKKAKIIVGGGETVFSFNSKFDPPTGGRNSKLGRNVFISTGGGAMLQFLSGKKLPGLEALK
jgi:phosphoglycerate kinase